MIKRMIKGHPTARRCLGEHSLVLDSRPGSNWRQSVWLAGCRCEQPPGSGHSLELMGLSVVEADVGADEQVLHRAGDQHLTVAGQGRDPGRDVDGQPSQVCPRTSTSPVWTPARIWSG